MRKITERRLLARREPHTTGLALAAITLALTTAGARAALPNGVAAGDVDQTSAEIWAHTDTPGTVTFQYSTDPNFASLLGTIPATATDSMIPVKVPVSGLTAGTQYYYRATDSASTPGVSSGTFRTAPALGSTGGLTFGISGDWRGELAPYPSIKNAPAKNLQFFLKFGDTIYGDVASPALNQPQAQTLNDYRIKHNEVQSSINGSNTFRDLNQSTAVFAVIDDHEVTDNFAGYDTVGARQAAGDARFNSPGLDGSTRINRTPLFTNGVQAFNEYMPIQDRKWDLPGDARMNGLSDLYRNVNYGKAAQFIVTDQRSFRDAELAPVQSNPNFLTQSFDASRTMLGAPQLNRLKADLLAAQSAGTTWKFVSVPEPIQNLGLLAAEDRYEGYAAERTQLLSFIKDNNINNVVFVTADIHGTLVNNLSYQTTPGGPQIKTNAFEISTGPVAYDAPFGPTVAGLAGAGAAYDAESLADKELLIQQIVNSQITPFSDPLGIEAKALSGIDATLTVGTWTATSYYGWTQFDIDPTTQVLTVTTYGIPYYKVTDSGTTYAGDPSLNPVIVQQFVVNPVPEPTCAGVGVVGAMLIGMRRNRSRHC